MRHAAMSAMIRRKVDIGADSFSGAASVLEWPFAQFAVTQQFSRFRSEADTQRTALTEPGFRRTCP